jgi:hypothetical protein
VTRVAELTGPQTGASALDSGLLLHMPEPARDVFAHATRLTPAEADGLVLSSYRHSAALPQEMPDSLRQGGRA